MHLPLGRHHQRRALLLILRRMKNSTDYKVDIDASYVINGLHLRSKHYTEGSNGDL